MGAKRKVGEVKPPLVWSESTAQAGLAIAIALLYLRDEHGHWRIARADHREALEAAEKLLSPEMLEAFRPVLEGPR